MQFAKDIPYFSYNLRFWGLSVELLIKYSFEEIIMLVKS